MYSTLHRNAGNHTPYKTALFCTGKNRWHKRKEKPPHPIAHEDTVNYEGRQVVTISYWN